MEAVSGNTQFGREQDDWGNWFGNSNPTWGWHYVLSDSYLKRNPYYAAPDPKQPLEPDTRLYPISRILPRFNDPAAAGHVTSANSPTPYRDDLFGPEFATSLRPPDLRIAWVDGRWAYVLPELGFGRSLSERTRMRGGKWKWYLS